MKVMYTYIVSLCLIAIFTMASIWFGSRVADACNACGIRVYHAAMVRDKWQRCKQDRYRRLSNECTESVDTAAEATQEGGMLWRAVCSESYGPTRQIKKQRRRAAVAPKRRSRSKRGIVNDDDHKELVTHRGAPFSLPLARGSFWISSRFGPRPRPDGSAGFHYGVDFAANRGTPVYAARAGVVMYAGHDNGYGKTIVLKHGAQFKTRYAHLDRIKVKTGGTVARGEVIGAVGATGHVRKKGGDGSHLHFELYYQGKRVDPLQFLPEFVS